MLKTDLYSAIKSEDSEALTYSHTHSDMRISEVRILISFRLEQDETRI